MLTLSAPSKQRDIIFRYYPFVLSKGIFLGFKFLCPGNHSLFKGAFQRILYLSIFRLLTGLDICPGSIDALRVKLYPDDAHKDEPSDADTEQDNELRPMGNQGEKPHLPNKIQSSAKANSSDFSYGSTSTSTSIASDKSPLKQQPSSVPRDSVVKFMGDRESLRFRPDKPQSLGPKILPRQQQVQFDSHQISPLLQQCLGRESISMGPKHFIKRTEPVAYCKSGGVETYRSRCEGTSIQDEDRRMEEHRYKTRELRISCMQATFENRKQLKALASQRHEILNGGRAKIQDFATSIMTGVK